MNALPILRSIGVRGLIIGLLVAALGVNIYLNRSLSNDLKEAQIEIGAKTEKISGLEANVETLRADADRYQKQTVASYNAAQTSCDRRIQASVEAMSAPITNPEPEVPENAPAGSPPVCNCPSVRLRDLTKPFGFQ